MTDKRVDGKIAVVIGGGSGIGEAAARTLAVHGATVVVADVNLEAPSRLREGSPAAGGLGGST